MKDATRDKVLEVLGTIIYFNPRIREGCDAPLFHPRFHSPVLIHASARDATAYNLASKQGGIILIHASMRDATVKSYKIGNNFAALLESLYKN